MKSKVFFFVILLTMVFDGFAQRVTDQLDRGLVAMKVSGGVFVSWRVLGEEYYDVQYNIYRGGEKLNAEPLNVSNFLDKSGTTSSVYVIKKVVKGVEDPTPSKEVKPWAAAYKEIELKHEGIKSTLVPNDACCADVDGDGELEIIMKFDNLSEMEQYYPKYGPKIDGVDTKEYSIFECLKMDGTRLWWINCGPNMGDFQNNEQNIAAYDWDGDGKAECVMRAADGTVIHMADGKTYTVGSSTANVRAATGGGTNWFVTTDGEYLLYLNGETGKPYQCISYPLKRLESGETDLNKAWGDGYGHRCSKHFFGAPYFDGKNPSIFLARGIYTRHKMIAYDVNPKTHTLKQRWRWDCNTYGPWKGNGYHNYCVADVDWDGRDEIVFGSMVIDDNGKGLSTTALGHGDAEHVGDLNPYIHGHEIYACLEDNPGNNYRDATTSKIYHRFIAGKDDGRCMAGNFTNAFPGGLGHSAREGAISLITNEAVAGLDATGVDQNFRIYWDGDLCEETFNGTGQTINDIYYPAEGCVHKYGSWTPIYTFPGSITNNYTKATPCYQGDLFGDWREEVIMRTSDNNIRIYSTTVTSKWRIPTLWSDHQYRNAMVWQMNGYNQPPRPSYYLGEIEGITVAPPPISNTGRDSVFVSGTVINATLNGKNALVFDNANMSISLEPGISPSVLTFNVPTWVQGSAPSECSIQDTKITYTTYSCTVTGGGLAGDSRLIKQGDGILNLPNADFTHTGNTDIWAGVVNFDGSMLNSDLWLNRFAELNSKGGRFKNIKMDYASILRPGGADSKGTITAQNLTLGFGSRLVVDLYSDDISSDQVVVEKLAFEHKTGTAWETAGPPYLMPVIELVGHFSSGQTKMKAGKYVIATMNQIDGTVDDLIVEGLGSTKKTIYIEDNKLIVEILPIRDAGVVNWDGATGGIWDLDVTPNFKIDNQEDPTTFVSEDQVIFGDDASNKAVSLTGSLYPSIVNVNSSKAYTFKGEGSIDGDAQFIKEGKGTVTMTAVNSYTGGNHLKGGITKVSVLSNQYRETGNLGGITTLASKFTIEDGATLQTTDAVEQASPMKMVGESGGIINNSADFRMAGALSGTLLTKRGTGCLFVVGGSSLSRMIIAAGSVAETSNPATTVEFQGGTLYDDAQCTTHNIYVPRGKTGYWHLSYANYTAYNNKVTGEGTLVIVPRNGVSRVRIVGNWTEFEGTIKHTNKDIWLPLDMSSGMPKGKLDIDAGCGVCNTAKAFTVGQLTGSGSLVQAGPDFKSQTAVKGNNTWNVGNSDGKNFTFAGTFTDAGGDNKVFFNKIGTCKMTVSGKSNHTGDTEVKGGELHFNSGATLGRGKLTVSSGATLSGASTAALTNSSYVFNNKSTLQVGKTETAVSDSINFGGQDVTFSSGSILKLGIKTAADVDANMKVGNPGGCFLKNIKKLTMNGTINLRLYTTFVKNVKEGDVVYLWKDVATVVGSPSLDPESLVIDAEKGLYWDTKDIASGILRVAYDPQVGISRIGAEPAGQQPIYTLDGRRVTTMTSGQIYIIGGRKILAK